MPKKLGNMVFIAKRKKLVVTFLLTFCAQTTLGYAQTATQGSENYYKKETLSVSVPETTEKHLAGKVKQVSAKLRKPTNLHSAKSLDTVVVDRVDTVMSETFPDWENSHNRALAHLWFDYDWGSFDPEKDPVVHVHSEMLDQFDVTSKKRTEIVRKFTRVLYTAYGTLSDVEKQALYDFQKNNLIKKMGDEWVELPLPISISDSLTEMAQVTPYEIVLHSSLLEASPKVLVAVLRHGLKRSLYRFYPDLQKHDAEVFQETLEFIDGRAETSRAMKQWVNTQDSAMVYGRDWKAAVLESKRLVRLDRAWRHIHKTEATELYDTLVAMPKKDVKAFAKEVPHFLLSEETHPPSHIYKEVYEKDGRQAVHVYIVYELSREVKKVVRLAPRGTVDWISATDTSKQRLHAALQIDLVYDVQTVSDDIVKERRAFDRHPRLLALVKAINTGTSDEQRDAIEEITGLSRTARDSTLLQRYATDILYAASRTHPNRDIRVELNRVLFDLKTERPVEFPRSEFNYMTFESEKYTLRFSIPKDELKDFLRVAWVVNGGKVQTADLSPVKTDKEMAYYSWKIPVQTGWIHYAVQMRAFKNRPWEYVTSVGADAKKLNGIVKFSPEVGSTRMLGMRPEIFNMRLDSNNNPIVDEYGNVMCGTLEDLRKQLKQIKDAGFNDIYLQVLEYGAPGEAGPDSSPFSPIGGMRISQRIGGMKGLRALKKEADALGIVLSLDMIPHFSRSDREISPRTAALIFDQIQNKIIRRAAGDGGLSPEWLDGVLRNWSDPRNVRDYINTINRLAREGYHFRIDVAHSFDTSYPVNPDSVGLERLYGHVTTSDETEFLPFEGGLREFPKTLDLRFTEEVNSLLAWIVYEAQKTANQEGHSVIFKGENWHGHEARLIQAGVIPFDPLVANAWNIIRDQAPATEYAGTQAFLNSVKSRFGGATVTAINNHDSQVPPVDAFGWLSFVATGTLSILQGGALMQHMHYSFRDNEGAIDFERGATELWKVPVNNYGPARVVNGQYWGGYDWVQKVYVSDAELARNELLGDLAKFEKRMAKLNEGYRDPFMLDVGHDRVACVARKKKNREDYLLGFFHQGSPYAADINFHPDNDRQNGQGLGVFEDDSVYEMLEVYNNENPHVSADAPGKRILYTGREVKRLGIGPLSPLPIAGMQVYRCKKIFDTQPKINEFRYGTLLESSLIRYDRYGPVDRFEHSFVSQQIVKTLEANNVNRFLGVFKKLSDIIAEHPELEIGDITRVFSDVIIYRPDLEQTLMLHLIHVAVRSEESTARVSNNAINVLRGATVGEVVLVTPEVIESSGTGGLALYITDLSKELARLGITVTVITPLFRDDKANVFKDYLLRDTGRTINVKFNSDGSETATAKIYEAYVSAKVELDDGTVEESARVRYLYLENDVYFNSLNDRKGAPSAYYGDGQYRLRFARMLSLGSLLAMREMNIHPSIIQTNEWGSAYVKPYLEGRERIDASLQNLKEDPHFAHARVKSIFHNLHRDYQGRIHEDDQGKRDAMIKNDLGFDPSLDYDVLVNAGDWGIINPTFTAFKTSDFARTVSEGYRQRSLNMQYNEEFGNLIPLFQWKAEQGKYDGEANGFQQSSAQKEYLPMLKKSFVEIGHESDRRKVFESIYDILNVDRKKDLQRAFDLPVDEKKCVYTFIARVGAQKGHQLLFANIWSFDNPYILRAFGGMYELFPDVMLSQEENEKLQAFARYHNKGTLTALEVAGVLLDDAQIILAGKAGERAYGDVLEDIVSRFQDKMWYENRFIGYKEEHNGVKRYTALNAYGSVFGMPSLFEPGGLGNLQAHAAGMPVGVTHRDGPADAVLSVRTKSGEEFTESFNEFNPVAWFVNLRDFYALYKDDPEAYKELRYKAIVQDNRWLNHAKNYIENYRHICGGMPVPALQELEIASAIHQSRLNGDKDPADELMKAGYTIDRAVGIVIKASLSATTDRLIKALVLENLEILKSLPEFAEIAEKHYYSKGRFFEGEDVVLNAA